MQFNITGDVTNLSRNVYKLVECHVTWVDEILSKSVCNTYVACTAIELLQVSCIQVLRGM